MQYGVVAHLACCMLTLYHVDSVLKCGHDVPACKLNWRGLAVTGRLPLEPNLELWLLNLNQLQAVSESSSNLSCNLEALGSHLAN